MNSIVCWEGVCQCVGDSHTTSCSAIMLLFLSVMLFCLYSYLQYGYSDAESVASTTASYSNLSMPINTKPLRPLQYRSPTPYNHEYQKTAEESIV